MIVFINPKAAGGAARKKWSRIAPVLHSRATHPTIFEMDGNTSLAMTLSEALLRGETDFVAAGGDGTINSLLNSLMTSVTTDRIQRMRLGAIGLGSSNDFHKPLQRENMIDGISCKLDFENAQPRDVGCLMFDDRGQTRKRYFLINASIGVTAEANRFFNSPDKILQHLKGAYTPGAILYAAVKTILSHQNFTIHIDCSVRGAFSTALSNLGIIKNPHFSGNLSYADRIAYENGKFILHLCHDMSQPELVKLLLALEHGEFNAISKTTSWETPSMKVDADEPFVVEFDGETVMTASVQFDVLPQCLKVCL